jgi:hypothetical protein
MVGQQAFRERFARPLFALIPELDGQVERFAIGADCAYIELTLRAPLAGVPLGASATGPPCGQLLGSGSKAGSIHQ